MLFTTGNSDTERLLLTIIWIRVLSLSQLAVHGRPAREEAGTIGTIRILSFKSEGVGIVR
jgi:hypothetical protein